MAVMPSNQCLWLLRQLTLFAWLNTVWHTKKGTLGVQENVEKKLLLSLHHLLLIRMILKFCKIINVRVTTKNGFFA